MPVPGLRRHVQAAAARLAASARAAARATPSARAEADERLWPLLDRGARAAQVNVCSLLGNNGPTAAELAELLVYGGHAHCLASDGHPGTREHTLRVGHDLLLRAGAGPLQAERLTQTNRARAAARGPRPPALAGRLAALTAKRSISKLGP